MPINSRATNNSDSGNFRPHSNLQKAGFALLCSLLSPPFSLLITLYFMLRYGAGLCYLSARAFIKTGLLGHNIKFLSLLFLPVLIVLSSGILLLVAAVYGLIAGFQRGYDEARVGAWGASLLTWKSINWQSIQHYRQQLAVFAASQPETGQTAFDLPVLSVFPALIGGLLGAGLYFVLISIYCVCLSLPALCRWDYLFFTKSSQPLLIRVLLVLISPFCAILFAAMAPLAGAIYAAIVCARDSYQQGLWPTGRAALQRLFNWHQLFKQYIFG